MNELVLASELRNLAKKIDKAWEKENASVWFTGELRLIQSVLNLFQKEN
jgi:hypothetical protein